MRGAEVIEKECLVDLRVPFIHPLVQVFVEDVLLGYIIVFSTVIGLTYARGT